MNPKPLYHIIPTLRLAPHPPRLKRQNPQIPPPNLPHILRLLVRRVPVSVTFMFEARCEGVQAVADEDKGDAADDYEEDDYFVGEVGHFCSGGERGLVWFGMGWVDCWSTYWILGAYIIKESVCKEGLKYSPDYREIKRVTVGSKECWMFERVPRNTGNNHIYRFHSHLNKFRPILQIPQKSLLLVSIASPVKSKIDIKW